MQTTISVTPRPAETVEPATTLLDEGKFLHILTELPGVQEQMIRIDVEKTTVTIAADDAGKRVKKMIVLPCEVSFCMKRFSEGVLTLTLEKTGPDLLISPASPCSRSHHAFSGTPPTQSYKRPG